MGFKVKIPTILSIIAIHFICFSPTTAEIDTAFQGSLGSFSRTIFHEIVKFNMKENTIFSPFSIQASIAMVRMGAEGETAAQMDRGLSWTDQDPQTVADNYHSMLAKYEQSNILKIANKVYVTQDNELSDEYRDVLTTEFFSEPENIDFSQTESAADAINSWVASKTDNMIQDLVSPDNLDASTRIFLLSAIHFDGKWESAFPKEDTKEADFFTDATNKVKVQMMEVKSTFLFGHPNDLDAAAVRLPYKDSDLSMLILLPYEINGFARMERKLRKIDLPSMVRVNVTKPVKIQMRLPKFKAEFQTELNVPLKKMGMKKMFSNADFGQMLKSPEPLAVSKVIHKAFIDVSEEGTKAAAVIEIDLYMRSANPFYLFDADHPFYYAIINEDFVPLFEGTYAGA